MALNSNELSYSLIFGLGLGIGLSLQCLGGHIVKTYSPEILRLCKKYAFDPFNVLFYLFDQGTNIYTYSRLGYDTSKSYIQNKLLLPLLSSMNLKKESNDSGGLDNPEVTKVYLITANSGKSVILIDNLCDGTVSTELNTESCSRVNFQRKLAGTGGPRPLSYDYLNKLSWDNLKNKNNINSDQIEETRLEVHYKIGPKEYIFVIPHGLCIEFPPFTADELRTCSSEFHEIWTNFEVRQSGIIEEITDEETNKIFNSLKKYAGPLGDFYSRRYGCPFVKGTWIMDHSDSSQKPLLESDATIHLVDDLGQSLVI